MENSLQELTRLERSLSHPFASTRGDKTVLPQDQDDAPLGTPDIVVLKVPRTPANARKSGAPTSNAGKDPAFNGIFSTMSETRRRIERDSDYQKQAEKEVAKQFSFTSPLHSASKILASRKPSSEQPIGSNRTVFAQKSDTRRSFVPVAAYQPVSTVFDAPLPALGISALSSQQYHRGIPASNQITSFEDQNALSKQDIPLPESSNTIVPEEIKPMFSPTPPESISGPGRVLYDVVPTNLFENQDIEVDRSPEPIEGSEISRINQLSLTQDFPSVMDERWGEEQVESPVHELRPQFQGHDDLIEGLLACGRSHFNERTKDVTKWQTCTLEAWKQGKTEITEKLAQILDNTNAYMKRKRSTYDELGGGIDAHQAQLAKRRKGLEEQGRGAASTCATLLKQLDN
ncbi:hypothetical protein FRC17_008333 [Serendipita sp. 399]|nr:hypothetical protein FRC17_008333 [Serendipita sp. 399]